MAEPQIYGPTVFPISGELVDDPETFARFKESAIGIWREACIADGGTPIGEPATEIRSSNANGPMAFAVFGMAIRD